MIKPLLLVKTLLAGVTAVFLMSFGGQAVAGPILVPMHIYCVRTGTVLGSAGWIVLGSLMSLETAYVYTLVFHAWWGTLIATGALVLGLGGVFLAAATKRDA